MRVHLENVMKLGPTTVTPVVTTAVRPDKAGASVDQATDKATAPARSAPLAEAVPVSVRTNASQLAQVRHNSSADIDQKKVDAVRTAIEKRSFKINAEVIADKMLSNAEEILQRQKN